MASAATVRAAVASALVSPVLLAGLVSCSDDQHPSRASAPAGSSPSSPSPSAVSSAGSSPSAAAPPTAPPYAAGAAGARAFAEHVMDLWGYGLRSNDARPLSALSGGHRPCAGCATFGHELAKRKRQGWSVDFPGVVVHTVTIRKAGPERVASAVVDIPESDSFNQDGTYRNTNPAHPKAHFTVRMRTAHQAYRLLSFTVS